MILSGLVKDCSMQSATLFQYLFCRIQGCIGEIPSLENGRFEGSFDSVMKTGTAGCRDRFRPGSLFDGVAVFVDQFAGRQATPDSGKRCLVHLPNRLGSVDLEDGTNRLYSSRSGNYVERSRKPTIACSASPSRPFSPRSTAGISVSHSPYQHHHTARSITSIITS
jgi:hypothetical protein